MRDFLSESKRFFDDTETLNTYTRNLEYLSNQKNNSVLSKNEEKEIDAQIDVLNGRFKELSRTLKDKLAKVSKENVKLKESNNGGMYYETRKMHLHAQSKKLTEAINRYREVQFSQQEDEKEKFKLQYVIARPGASDNEIDECIQADDGDAKLASAYALGSHSAQGILEEAQNRKKSIKKIAGMVEDLVIILDEISSKVDESDKVVVSISEELAVAEENTQNANKDLESAIKYQIRATKIKRILFLIFVFIVVVGILWILFKFGIIDAFRNRNNN